MLLFHIVIALSGIAYATFTFFKPSKVKMYASCALTVATIATGTYLIVIKPSHMVQACFMGLVILSYVTVMLIGAHVKLRKLEVLQ